MFFLMENIFSTRCSLGLKDQQGLLRSVEVAQLHCSDAQLRRQHPDAASVVPLESEDKFCD
jgi:hypothetical protein